MYNFLLKIVFAKHIFPFIIIQVSYFFSQKQEGNENEEIVRSKTL